MAKADEEEANKLEEQERANKLAEQAKPTKARRNQGAIQSQQGKAKGTRIKMLQGELKMLT